MNRRTTYLMSTTTTNPTGVPDAITASPQPWRTTPTGYELVSTAGHRATIAPIQGAFWLATHYPPVGADTVTAVEGTTSTVVSTGATGLLPDVVEWAEAQMRGGF